MTVVTAGETITLEETFYADNPEDAKSGARMKVAEMLTLLQDEHPEHEVGLGDSHISKLRYSVLPPSKLSGPEATFNPDGKPVWFATCTWQVQLLEPVVNG